MRRSIDMRKSLSGEPNLAAMRSLAILQQASLGLGFSMSQQRRSQTTRNANSPRSIHIYIQGYKSAHHLCANVYQSSSPVKNRQRSKPGIASFRTKFGPAEWEVPESLVTMKEGSGQKPCRIWFSALRCCVHDKGRSESTM